MDNGITNATLDGPYDLIVVGQNVLNSLGNVEASSVLQQISDALKSTGRVVLFETVSEVTQSPYPQIQSIQMVVTQAKGKVHNNTWFKDLLTSIGFVSPTVCDCAPFAEKLLITFRNIIAHHQKQSSVVDPAPTKPPVEQQPPTVKPATVEQSGAK